MRRLVIPLVLGCGLAAGATVAPSAPPSCNTLPAELGDPALHCMDLVPAVDLPDGAVGIVRLEPAASPYGVAVTADGISRWRLGFSVAGLPAAKALGARVYVAWIATPLLDRITRLGVVRNGSITLGPATGEQFTIFVSAERDSAPAAPGRLVLRGLSPATAVRPHGGRALPAQNTAGHMHHSDSTGWELPPMHPRATSMPPGLEVLRPRVMPWQAGANVEGTLPPPRAREIHRLRTGDTLRLEAGLVQRHVAGRTFVAYAFNGQSPGPLLEVTRGARITVEFVNRLDLPSAVHWHGLRQDWRMDGAVGVSQDAVPPGGHFTYQLHFPDAGIYWYHPHVREDIEQELGLYGNMLVRTDNGWGLGPVHREEMLVLDDLLLGKDGPLPFGQERATHALMGRMGNVLLVNGEPRWNAQFARGEVARLYFTNTANTRTFNLSIPGARLKLVAGDGGRFERETWVESVVLAPAERYVVDVRFEQAGEFRLLNRVQGIHPTARAFMTLEDTLGVVTVTAEAAVPDLRRSFDSLRTSREMTQAERRYRRDVTRPPDRTLVLTLREDSLPFGLVQALRLDTAWVPPVEWAGLMPMMDWLSTGREVRWILRDPSTGRENMDIDWRFRRGTRLKLRLVNDRHTLHAMQHPVHLHGQRFLVLARNGTPQQNLVWKDTVLLPAGSTADLLVELDNPGLWMLHCHIAEHLESGMHMVFTVNGER